MTLPTPPRRPPSAAQLQARILLVRIAMILVVAASVALVWWSTSKRLVPASRALRDRTLESARIANDVQKLEMSWNADEVARVEARYREAQNRLFSDGDAFTEWQQHVQHRAEAFGLEPNSHTGQGQAQAVAGHKLTRVPVFLDLHPLDFARNTNTPYRRLLQFAREMEAGSKRVDLMDVSLSGNTNSVREARFVLSAWTREPEGATANGAQTKATP